MASRIVAALVAVVLVVAYVAPIAFKMKDVALASVILIGVVVMLVDLWHSLQKPNE